MRLFTGLIIFSAMAFANADKDWAALEKMKGEWVGDGKGKPGDSTGSFTFLPDLQGKVYIRKNRADYPATKDRPAFTHEDLMTVYRDGDIIRADYFDNEGHVIRYIVTASADQTGVIFVSSPEPKAPRYRLRYNFGEPGRMKLAFDMAAPGKPDQFQNYVEASLRRK